jgi:hypothetical protein
MTLDACAREQDVLDAIAARRWPERCDRDLRAHVAQCAVCADLAEVAPVLRDDHDGIWREARVPSAGLVWWRAEMRARREAARVATRPILVVQIAAALSAVVVGGFLLWALGASPTAWARDAADWLGRPGAASAWPALDGPRLTLLLAVGAWVLAVPLAMYWALRD